MFPKMAFIEALGEACHGTNAITQAVRYHHHHVWSPTGPRAGPVPVQRKIKANTEVIYCPSGSAGDLTNLVVYTE